MRILLTNDDGIYAPGLQALPQGTAEARRRGRSSPRPPSRAAAGHSVTLLTPLIVQEVLDDGRQFLGWAVEGRPADCVKLALVELLPEPPDLIVSGLNAGSNAGINVLYSGTVAAAIEGAFFRRTSIAVSLAVRQAEAARLRRRGRRRPARSSSRSWTRSPTPASLFNVNIPRLELRRRSGRPRAAAERGRRTRRASTAAWTRAAGRTTGSGADFGCPDPHPDTDETALAEATSPSRRCNST